MELHLRSRDRSLRVRLVPRGDDVVATVDDAEHLLVAPVIGPAATAAGGTTVEEVAVVIDGRRHRALVARRRDEVLVSLDGRVYRFETGEAARSAGAAAGSGSVRAPMPGKVTAVLVAPDDTVEAGQPLVVLEAMKMESTLTAEIAGRVRAVSAVQGATVAAGDVLVEIEPAGA